MKKTMNMLLVVIVALGMAFTSMIQITAKGDGSSQIEQLITYYLSYQDAAETDIQRVVNDLKNVDEQEGEAWEKIMDYWMYVNRDMNVNTGVVPSGFVTDDSLCFVVLGFALNDDGTMKDELIGRLQVALDSAKKYPNAYIACTGGGTAKDNPNATEADQMAQWLIDQGVDENRIIVENKSKNTVQNAQFTYAILREKFPQIESLAMITSDYHVPRGCVLYNSQLVLSAYEAGDKLLNIVSNAGYDAGHDGYESLALQARGVCQIANLNELSDKINDNTYEVPKLSILKELNIETKDTYLLGEELKLNVYANYDSGYTRDVTELAEISGYNADKLGKQTITATYLENDVEKTASFIVNVKEKETINDPVQEPDKDIQSGNESKGDVPTGDATGLYGWLTMMLLSAVALTVYKLRIE